MALRYSGDVEVRVWWDPKTKEYHGHVRDPYLRWHGRTSRRGLLRSPTSPEAYDAAALDMLQQAATWARGQRLRQGFQTQNDTRGRIVVERVFKAPCPVS